MTRIVKIRQNFVHCFSSSEIDRFQLVNLGKNIYTNNALIRDSRLNQYFNEYSMSALDNYAEHEGIKIHIKSLENDMFNDVAVSVRKGKDEKSFPLNVPKSKESVPEFFRELYNNIHGAIYGSNGIKTKKTGKSSIIRDAKIYFQNIPERLHNMKLRRMKNFVDKHGDERGLFGLIAEAIEEVHYNELYNLK